VPRAPRTLGQARLRRAGQHALTFQSGSCPEGSPCRSRTMRGSTLSPREKIYKLFDGHGLYLQIAPTGGKWWRVKYRLRGREQCLSLGTFPAVALKAARQRCEELRAKPASGVDPAAERRLAKQQLRMKDESLEVIAREWYATFSRNWAPTHGDRVLRRLETYVFPWIGKIPIREVTAMNVLECLRRLEHQNTHETARRVLRYSRCGSHRSCSSAQASYATQLGGISISCSAHGGSRRAK